MIGISLNKVLVTSEALWCFGPRWALFRFGYALRQKCGLLQRRMPAYTWKERPLRVWLESGIPSDHDDYFAWRKENAGRFFFPDLKNISPHLRSSVPTFCENVTEEADKLLSGYLQVTVGYKEEMMVEVRC